MHENRDCESCGHEEQEHVEAVSGYDGSPCFASGCICSHFRVPVVDDLPDERIDLVPVPEVHGVALTPEVISTLRTVEAIEALIHPQRITLSDWRAAVARIGAEA